MFYILDGQFAFISGNQTMTGTTGDAFYLPKNVVHTFKNVGAKPGPPASSARRPTGFEKFVPEAGCPCTDASPACTSGRRGRHRQADGRLRQATEWK